MTVLAISEFCKTGSGGTPSRSKRKEYYEGGTIPWIKSGELAQSVVSAAEEFITEKGLTESSAKLLKPGAILIAMYGATVGQVSRLAIPAATNQAVCHIYPDLKLCDPDYLYRVLKGAKDKLLDRRVGGGQPNISQKIVRDLQIPLPPLAEQKRIAAILDATDALRAKRRETLAQLDTLLQSTFLYMFGDPVTNPKGWEVKALKDGVVAFEGGRNLMPTEQERRDGIRVLKVSAVTSGEYRPDESKPFAEGEMIAENHIVKQGDLLISRANTAALVGAVSYVWKTGGREMLPDKLWRFVWTIPHRIEPLFMLHFARSCYFREQLIQRATGTSGSMKNIGKAKMLDIPIPFPPLTLQHRFATIVESVEKQKSRLRAHLAELDTLFASLQQRAFNGEL